MYWFSIVTILQLIVVFLVILQEPEVEYVEGYEIEDEDEIEDFKMGMTMGDSDDESESEEGRMMHHTTCGHGLFCQLSFTHQSRIFVSISSRTESSMAIH